jgi:hypothetical protein
MLGCVCADGHYKTNCPAMTKAAKQIASDSCCGGSSCRAGCRADRKATEPCCSCCKRTDSSNNANPSSQDATAARLAKGNGCCHAVFEVAVPPLLLNIVQVEDVHNLPNASGLVFESFGQFDAAAFGGRVDDDTGQFPGDLVIMLRRLLI